MHIVDLIHLQSNPIELSFLEVDCDLNAERLIIFNRKSGEKLASKRIYQGRFTTFLIKDYSFSNDLMCVMLDDNSEFNAAIADNVQPILIDLVSFDPENPLPYEPPA